MAEITTNSKASERSTANKAARMRSPNYPGIGLREAVDRAHVFYNADKRNWAHVDNALHHWGFKPSSGAGGVVVAALKAFGLLEDEGAGKTRRVRLTDSAMRLLLLDPAEHSDDRRSLLQGAALKPKIHAELWKFYKGSLPSDSTLRYELMTSRGFTDNAVKEFIPQFKDTVAFAELAAGDKLTGHDGDKNSPPNPFDVPAVTAPSAVTTPPTSSSAGQVIERPSTRVVTLPLSGDAWAALQVPVPMSEEDWEQMLAVLSAMKRGIVKKS